MPPKKKILFFIDSLNCGGAEKSIVSLLRLLNYNIYEVDLLLFARGGVFEKYLPKEVNVLSFRDFYPLSLKERFRQIIYSVKLRVDKPCHSAELRWRSFSSCYGVFPRNYDVAIAYQQGFPTYFVASYVNASKKISWINADLKKAGYNPEFNRPYYRKYNATVAVSENLRDLIREYTSDNEVYVITDIVNPQQVIQMSQESCPIQAPNSGIIITTVGRLAPPKGYDLAIGAAEILKARGVDFTWHFVGDGPLHQSLKAAIIAKGLQDNIVLDGEQSNPYPFMRIADIYVQPSWFEGFGITIAEAKILCKPIISTNFPVVYNQLRHEVDSIIVEMKAMQIAEAIMRLINEPNTRKRFSEKLSTYQSTSHLTEADKVMSLL